MKQAQRIKITTVIIAIMFAIVIAIGSFGGINSANLGILGYILLVLLGKRPLTKPFSSVWKSVINKNQNSDLDRLSR